MMRPMMQQANIALSVMLAGACLIAQTGHAQDIPPRLMGGVAASWSGRSDVEAYTTDGRERLTVYHQQARTVHLAAPARRVAIADDTVADFRLISPTELYIVGKSIGRTNLLVWDRAGRTSTMVLDVSVDVEDLAQSLRLQLPPANRISVSSSSSSIVLGGMAVDAVSADAAVRIAETYAINLNRIIAEYAKQTKDAIATDGGKPVAQGLNLAGDGAANSESNKLVRVVNLMKIRDGQQVMLEVRIAEVSKSLSQRLGVGFTIDKPGGTAWSIGSDFLGAGAGTGSLLFNSNGTSFRFDVDAERKRGTFRILAEPTIAAMSGQEGSFLVGGKILIPVTQAVGNSAGITLEERQFGVGLTFLPTVLDDGRINLKVTPEVSELSKDPVAFGTGSVLPAFTTSRVSTTVQLRNGQSLVIGGLLRNATVKAMKGLPLLSEIPILGALFRSKDFASDQTELVVVVRPVLVEATDRAPVVPNEELNPDRLEQLDAQRVLPAPENAPASENLTP